MVTAVVHSLQNAQSCRNKHFSVIATMGGGKRNLNKDFILEWMSLATQEDQPFTNAWQSSETLHAHFTRSSNETSCITHRSFTKILNELSQQGRTTIASNKIWNNESRTYNYLFKLISTEKEVQSNDCTTEDFQMGSSESASPNMDVTSVETFDSPPNMSSPNPINMADQASDMQPSPNNIDLILKVFKYTTNSRFATNYILSSLDLDFTSTPRLDIRPNSKHAVIEVEPKIAAHELTKWHCCLKLSKCDMMHLKKK